MRLQREKLQDVNVFMWRKWFVAGLRYQRGKCLTPSSPKKLLCRVGRCRQGLGRHHQDQERHHQGLAEHHPQSRSSHRTHRRTSLTKGDDYVRVQQRRPREATLAVLGVVKCPKPS